MKKGYTERKNQEIDIYIENQEYIANNYVMKCFSVYMILYTGLFIVNQMSIFTIDKKLMMLAYIPSLIIYFFTCLITKRLSMSHSSMKYIILFCFMSVSTITGVFLTYHVVVAMVLPLLYALLYSSKTTMRYIYILTIISTIIIVYGGYYYGLCDANMVLLTEKNLQGYLSEGRFILTKINPNPQFSLFLFFVVPRCFIYLTFIMVGQSLFNIVRGSLEKARLTAELEKAKEEAENASRAKTQFLAKMSHEIRTPVNAIMGMNEMILRESKDVSIRNYAGDMKHSSEELLSIINEILDSSKIESGRMEIVCADYDLNP